MLIRKKLIRQSIGVGAVALTMGVGIIPVNVYADPVMASTGVQEIKANQTKHTVKVKSYEEVKPSYVLKGNIPQLSGKEKQTYIQNINKQISREMEKVFEESKTRGEESYKAYIATGGKETDYRPVYIQVDYDVNYNAEGSISLGIYKTESIGSAHNTAYFYNFDLKNEKEITLEDFYGENCKNIIDKQIRLQMKERTEKEGATYFEDFKGIKEDQNFYINEKGNPVIVFDEYEIAPGSMGMQYFEIATPEKLLKLTPQAHYNIKRCTLDSKQDVAYPQVEGYKGELVQDYINQSLYKVVEKYEDKIYSDLRLDYKIMRMDDQILSVYYKGSVDIEGLGTKMFVDSMNIDLTKTMTVDEINVQNLILPTQEAQATFKAILTKKLNDQGIKDLEIEGLRVYFKDGRAVFYYMLPDDSVQQVVEIVVPLEELEGIIQEGL